MATPTMPTGTSTTTPKKRTFSTMAGETSPGLKLRINTVEDELDKENLLIGDKVHVQDA